MSAIARTFDEKIYRRALGRALPRPIRSDGDLERMTERLLEIEESVEDGTASPEQCELAELLGMLIDQYEDEHRQIAITSAPHERLADLLAERGMSQTDLATILNSRSLASEILSGRRGISKAQVIRFAGFFHVPAEVFLDRATPTPVPAIAKPPKKQVKQ